MKADRRAFVGRGLALAGLAGTITGLDSSARTQTETSNGPSFASFGWEASNLNNNGADVYVEVTSNMIMTSLDTDISFMLTSLPANAGFAEVLCRAAVSPEEHRSSTRATLAPASCHREPEFRQDPHL